MHWVHICTPVASFSGRTDKVWGRGLYSFCLANGQLPALMYRFASQCIIMAGNLQAFTGIFHIKKYVPRQSYLPFSWHIAKCLIKKRHRICMFGGGEHLSKRVLSLWWWWWRVRRLNNGGQIMHINGGNFREKTQYRVTFGTVATSDSSPSNYLMPELTKIARWKDKVIS